MLPSSTRGVSAPWDPGSHRSPFTIGMESKVTPASWVEGEGRKCPIPQLKRLWNLVSGGRGIFHSPLHSWGQLGLHEVSSNVLRHCLWAQKSDPSGSQYADPISGLGVSRPSSILNCYYKVIQLFQSLACHFFNIMWQVACEWSYGGHLKFLCTLLKVCWFLLSI